MAGGSYPRGAPYGSLAQRGIIPRAAAGGPNPTSASDDRPARHCWVHDAPGRPGPAAGLLLEWRQGPNGTWEGLVVFAIVERGRPALLQTWLPAEQLSPAGPTG